MATYDKVNRELVPCFDLRHIPPDVTEACIDLGISMHYENALARVGEEDDDVLVEWLKAQGVEFKNGVAHFGIWVD